MSVRAVAVTNFQNLLSGPDAFYNRPDYDKVTEEEFSQVAPLAPSYIVETENPKTLARKEWFKIPIRFVQKVFARMGVLPTTDKDYVWTKEEGGNGEKVYSPEYLQKCRKQILLDKEFKYKRFTVRVDGMDVDAMIVGKTETLANGRFFLYSTGNGWTMANKMVIDRDIKQIATESKGNFILFDYPGTGSSSGKPSKAAMLKAYKAMMMLIENEIKPKELIPYGFSMGGGVQGQFFETHKPKEEIDCVLVKTRTYENFPKTVLERNRKALAPNAGCFTRFVKLKVEPALMRIFHWNFDSLPSTKKVTMPQIILQRASVETYTHLHDSSKIIDDKDIPATASLAKAVLDDTTCDKENIMVIGIKEDHSDPMINVVPLCQMIDEKLKEHRELKAQRAEEREAMRSEAPARRDVSRFSRSPRRRSSRSPSRRSSRSPSRSAQRA